MHVAWAKGGEADLVAFDGDDRVTLSSTISSPPGAYVDGTLNELGAIRIKVRSCKRDEERFHIEARILDVSRQLRERLSALATRS